MNEKNIHAQDEQLKVLLAGTKLKAGENLKYRIMRQIETEQALSPQKVKNSVPLVINMLSVFGIMYALIAALAVGIFLTGGINDLKSMVFLLPVLLIAFVCSFFCMISVYDDRRRSKQYKETA